MQSFYSDLATWLAERRNILPQRSSYLTLNTTILSDVEGEFMFDEKICSRGGFPTSSIASVHEKRRSRVILLYNLFIFICRESVFCHL